MFASLSDRLAETFRNLRGKGRLSEADVDATVREIRRALLDADVALPAVKAFTAAIRERALGSEVASALNPALRVSSCWRISPCKRRATWAQASLFCLRTSAGRTRPSRSERFCQVRRCRRAPCFTQRSKLVCASSRRCSQSLSRRRGWTRARRCATCSSP